MKRLLLFTSAAVALVFASHAQQRYIDEVFTSVDFTFGTEYGQNYHFIPLHDSPINPTQSPGPIPPLGYTPTLGPMTMDVYQPNGDSETQRPLVIILHTGNFLPRYINRSPVGDKGDSVIVELGNRLAKRGYVAAAPRYRLGWNPTSADPVTRTRTLLVAVYRAIHDVQTCVRFFKANAGTYKIDPSKIVIWGVGSGGYVSNAYATLDKQEETALEKFQDYFGNSVVDTTLWGNVHGVGGSWNNYNHSGHSNSVAMCVNMGGALGDISWMEGGEVTTIGFHCYKDQFAPYDSGNVIVPTTGDPVVFVHGTRTMIKKAVSLGNNDVLLNSNFTDPISQRAYSLNPKAQFEGLYEFRTPTIPASPINREEGSPWDWWDSTTVVATASLLGLPSSGTAPNGNPNNLHLSGLLHNPDMSAAKARVYVDTIMKFACPRIAAVLGLANFSISEADQESSLVSVFPNPVSADFSVAIQNEQIRRITLTDLGGKTIRVFDNLNAGTVTLDRGTIPAGVYVLEVNTSGAGRFTRRVVFK